MGLSPPGLSPFNDTGGNKMKFERKSGILLHPTSLPGTPGIGTFGKEAYKFIDWLKSGGQTLWQVLPLGPTGYGDSPYASFSTFAGNPLLVDFEMLCEKGWADSKDVVPPDYISSSGPVDFGAVVWWKTPALEKCARHFLACASSGDMELFRSFCTEKSSWLDNYALFMSIKRFYDGKAQSEKAENSVWYAFWPRALASADEEALRDWTSSHSEELDVIKVIQFFFDFQWNSLRRYAAAAGVSIIGDIPIFVAADSADVWANQKFFQLSENGAPAEVAGVPPDYFSADGQLWGNPLYDWDAMKADGYSWWISRIKRVLELADCLRIDHFRGFEAYWSVPAGERTAVNGRWRKGPGMDLFNAVRSELGDIPVIAEDLGVITDEVRKLRDDCGFPGMKVLEFAFSVEEASAHGMTNSFLPHNFTTSSCVVYTGTHDNETLQGWLEHISTEQKVLVDGYVRGKKVSPESAESDVRSGKLRKELVRLAFASSADYAVVPVQDVIGAGDEGRMNMPSTTGANWAWRLPAGSLRKSYSGWLKFLSEMYGRNIVSVKK